MAGFIMRNECFNCQNCNTQVSAHPNGSARNHCPYCLYSKHLDEVFPWDRASACHGMMKPVATNHKKNKGWMIEHECQTCHKKILNKVAEDDDMEVFATISQTD